VKRDDYELGIPLPAAVVEALAEAIAQRLEVPLSQTRVAGSPWLNGSQEAADYLRWPKGRVDKSIRLMPHYRERGRLMFRREELDAWLEGFYEGPPRLAEGCRNSATSGRSHRSKTVPRMAREGRLQEL